MEGQSGDHDVDAQLILGVFVGIGGGGDATPDGLQQQGDEIAADEEDGVRCRAEA